MVVCSNSNGKLIHKPLEDNTINDLLEWCLSWGCCHRIP